MISSDPSAQSLPFDPDALGAVTERFPFRRNGYYMSLSRRPGDPIWRQIVPDRQEIDEPSGWEDPLAEESLSPAPNLVHRYPNRVLWLVSSTCAMYCRFCTRKRRWKEPQPLDEAGFRAGLDYIRTHGEIRDVLLSGGDPLLLPLSRLEAILAALRTIPHVEILRIGTRIPCVLPHAVTPELCAMLGRYHPLFVNIHFNHPWELTAESRKACGMLADAGVPLGSQTVLLRGVNDEAEVLGDLFQSLLGMRVRPYYLMQMDLTQGTAHFRTPIGTGLNLLRALRNHISGLAMPQFVVDLPGGQGKIPLLPNYVESVGENRLILRDYRRRLCEYPLLPGEQEALNEWMRQEGR